MYDLIGDIHGHADELMRLLEVLGYRKLGQIYRHPERKVIFLGDFIDRGPQIRLTLELVRAMVQDGQAQAVMGNHELNALAYHTPRDGRPGEYLRKHDAKNEHQHHQTLLQLSADELADALQWFRTLPMWLEMDGLRAIHACWDDRSIATIQRVRPSGESLSTEFLHAACLPGQPLFEAVETILKGKEVPLPAGYSFADKDGHQRTRTRVRWYASPHGQTYQSYALTNVIDCTHELEVSLREAAVPYPPDAKPVFVGHYWLIGQPPELLADNVACLDYSVAKGGFLCAYRWQGEQTLSKDHFHWVGKSL